MQWEIAVSVPFHRFKYWRDYVMLCSLCRRRESEARSILPGPSYILCWCSAVVRNMAGQRGFGDLEADTIAERRGGRGGMAGRPTSSMRARSRGVIQGQPRRVGICHTYCEISTPSVYTSTACEAPQKGASSRSACIPEAPSTTTHAPLQCIGACGALQKDANYLTYRFSEAANTARSPSR